MNEEEIREMQEEAEERERARQERGGATDEQLNQAYKELQDPKDPRREEKFLEERAKRKKAKEEGDDPNIAGEAGGLGFEIAFGLATDQATRFLLNPALGPKGIALYGLANFASGAVANAIAQRMRGDKSFSLGEILASGAAGVIPGSTAKLGKKGSKILGEANTIKRAGLVGGLTGVGSEQIRVGIDEQRPLTFNEAALAGVVGGTTSASLQRISKNISDLAKDYYRKVQDNQVAFFTEDELFEMGINQPMAIKFADEITPTNAAALKNDLDTRAAAGTYGFQYTNVSSKPRRNQFGIPNDIATVYLNAADDYKKNMGPDDTLRQFPTLIWNNKRYRPKSKGDYTYFDDLVNRQTLKKINNKRRALSIWKQTRPGVKKGNFFLQKLIQLRKLNTDEAVAGIPEAGRTKLRDVDMDHKNALRSVEDYTEGLTPKGTEKVFDLMEEGGLFTGDDTRNLILRNRSIHRKLWPTMKKALAKLNHRRRKDFGSQRQYINYLTQSINPKTGDTPIQEYIDTINFIEEQASDEAFEMLATKVRQLYGGQTGSKQSPTYQRLVEILGGEENLEAFIRRLQRDVAPTDVRRDLIRGEFDYIGSFGAIPDSDLDDVINELTQ
jgi:hypothetical protein